MDNISIVKFLSIPTAFLLSGYGLGFSQNSVPLLYKQPASISAPLLEGIYYQGAKVVAPGAILATTGLAYLAYTARTSDERNLYGLAAALTFASQPWTALVMLPGIHRLIEIGASAAEQTKADASGEAVQLLQGWVWQNAVRAALNFASGAVGFWAFIQYK